MELFGLSGTTWVMLWALALYYFFRSRKKGKKERGENVPEDDEDEDDESEETNTCPHCDNPLTSKDSDGDGWTCEGCDEEGLCDNCSVGIGGEDGDARLIICKQCIDEAYPRKEKVVEKIVVKRVEVPKEIIKVLGFSEPIL